LRGVDLNHRPLGYEPDRSVLNPVDSAVLTRRSYAKRPLFLWILVPSLSQVSWAGLDVGLSGSAGVLGYFFFAYYLFGTTVRFLVQLVGLPLFFIGFSPILCHANSLPQAGLDS